MLEIYEQQTVPDPGFPDFVITRLQTGVHFEPTRVETPDAYTYTPKAYIDSGAPYTVVPHIVLESGHVKVYQELGQRPYRLLSQGGKPFLQRFAEVALRFRGPLPGKGRIDYWPESFVRVKAFLLEADVRPLGVVLIGLDTLLSHFLLRGERGNTSLDLRGTEKPA